MMMAGFAEVDITPSGEVDLSGYVGREQPSVGVRDPISCTALALSDGMRRAVLVSCDLIGLTYESVDRVRAYVAARAGAPEPYVFVACTHTHSGPATVDLLGCGRLEEGYLLQILPRIAECALAALSSLTPAEIRWGTAESKLAENRRAGGAGGAGGSQAAPEPDRTVLAVEASAGDGRCAVVRYGCHCVLLDGDNREVSADLAGSCRDELSDRMSGSGVVYLAGACGDVNPAGRGEVSPEQAGADLAEVALSALRLAEPIPQDSRLAYEEVSVVLPVSIPPLEGLLADVRREHDLYIDATYAGEDVERRVHAVREAWASQLAESVRSGRIPEGVPLRVARLSVGPLTFIGIAAEAFDYFDRMVRQAHGDAVFVVGYANGLVGYLPSPEAFDEGGYEVEDAHKFYGGLPLSPDAPAVALAAIDRLLWA